MFWVRHDAAAGRTTADYYERRLKAWHRSLRARLAVALVLACSFAYPFWRWMPDGAFFAGLVVGGCAGMMLWIWDEPPEFIAKWGRGAEGERKTSQVLRKLEPAGWSAVHDRTTGKGNVDHIAVSEHGVFLLESKNLNWTISIDDEGLTAVYGDAEIDAFTNRRLAPALRAGAARLRERITAATRLTYCVQIVVVIWGEFPEGLAEARGITFVAGERLGAWLEQQPRRMSRRDASCISLALKADEVAPAAPPLEPAAT